MAEQDRLAALLERATRERREDADGVDLAEGDSGEPIPGGGADSGEPTPGEGADSGELDILGEDLLVAGGEWLPPDPGRHRPAREGPRMLALPQSLRSLNLGVRPVAVVALLVVALIAAGIFGWRWWRAEQGSAPVPVAPLAAQLSPAPGGADAAGATGDSDQAAGGQEAAGVSDPTAAAATGSPSASAEAPAELLVHVAGEVRSAGVVRLDPGARVQDAVEAAGGLGPDADTSRLNLARAVADGERIWVPRPGEEVPEVTDVPVTPPAAGGGGSAGAESGGGEAQININTADQAVLEELPGVGPVTAGAIVAWREENGQFSSPDELLEVSGIGEATLDKLRPHVTL
ncbi:ComEA family DNA-binding protein [Ornithinimicrobium faecis]|uniref:ComEA family DNA-binding protein n=1 Tax=Ornithinimicrobium faecis TaxID=2934158 RepID=A0ABY4YWK5_9MICO|nr:ComEA family DNA-binding protein [Ornithinimicrobium sp. HY1793]USQ81143.1 ComEA family DNA-binding protein [Ornithinimicrobium sp. HY1793]